MRYSSFRLLSAVLLAAFFWPSSTVASSGAATLAPNTPRVDLLVEAVPSADAILQVVVSQVRNPDKVPVSVLVTVQDSARRAVPVEVMRFALFPADEPGRFNGRADQALDQLAARLGARPSRLVVVVEFDPVAGPGRAKPPPVELRVSALWIATASAGR